MCGAQGKKIVIYPWFSSIHFNFVLYFSIISFSKHWVSRLTDSRFPSLYVQIIHVDIETILKFQLKVRKLSL